MQVDWVLLRLERIVATGAGFPVWIFSFQGAKVELFTLILGIRFIILYPQNLPGRLGTPLTQLGGHSRCWLRYALPGIAYLFLSFLRDSNRPNQPHNNIFWSRLVIG